MQEWKQAIHEQEDIKRMNIVQPQWEPGKCKATVGHHSSSIWGKALKRLITSGAGECVQKWQLHVQLAETAYNFLQHSSSVY